MAITDRVDFTSLSSLSLDTKELLYRGITPYDHDQRSSCPRAKVLPGGFVVKHFKGCSRVPTVNGFRGEIAGFSLDSRRRLRMKLMAIDWQACDWLWVTLTYHNTWSEEPDEWKTNVQTWFKRLIRAWRNYSGLVWRLEFQKRGAPHFHLLVGFKRGAAPKAAAFQAWSRQAWAEILDGADDKHLVKHGCRVCEVCDYQNMGALLGYLVNELGKVQQQSRKNEMGISLPTGRVWGVKGDLPMVSIADIDFADEVEFEKFIKRVNERSVIDGDYFSKITTNWSGFVLMGDGLVMLEMLDGLNYSIRPSDAPTIN